VALAASAGLGYAVSGRVTVAVDLFYAPLTVARPERARALVSYRVIR